MAAATVPREIPNDVGGRVTAAESKAMLKTVLHLLDRWRVSNAQKLVLLGGPSDRTFQRWRTGDFASLPTDTIYRLSDLLAIHKALRYVFADTEGGYRWVKRPNDAFAGRSALDVMLQGCPVDLNRVRAYLDAERGGW